MQGGKELTTLPQNAMVHAGISPTREPPMLVSRMVFKSTFLLTFEAMLIIKCFATSGFSKQNRQFACCVIIFCCSVKEHMLSLNLTSLMT